MGSSLPKFEGVDLASQGENETPTARPPPPRRTRSFGELDLESIGAALAEYEDGPSQQTNTKPASKASARGPMQTCATRQSLEAVRLAVEETRIAKAGALAEAISAMSMPDGESVTKVATLDSLESLRSLDRPSPSRSGRTAPSASGVATKDDRVAEMRELYASGNAEAALALATAVAEGFSGARREAEPVDDGFGGLIPVEEDDGFGGLVPVFEDDNDNPADAADSTAIIAAADSKRLMRLSQRPRVLCSSKELAKLPMDPRAAFILGHVDGRQSMGDILDVCPMPEAEALELIERLNSMGVIALD